MRLLPRLFAAPAQSPLGSAILILCLSLITSACTRVPQIEDQIDSDLRGQPYPDFVPLDAVLAPHALPQKQNAEIKTDLDKAAARLRRRAAALRQRTL